MNVLPTHPILNAVCNSNNGWNSIGYDDANDYTMHITTMI